LIFIIRKNRCICQYLNGNWVSSLFHAWYFRCNIPDYWFKKFLWLDVLLYFLSYFFYFYHSILIFKIKNDHPSFLKNLLNKPTYWISFYIFYWKFMQDKKFKNFVFLPGFIALQIKSPCSSWFFFIFLKIYFSHKSRADKLVFNL
jgi:hypothetical protein